MQTGDSFVGKFVKRCQKIGNVRQCWCTAAAAAAKVIIIFIMLFGKFYAVSNFCFKSVTWRKGQNDALCVTINSNARKKTLFYFLSWSRGKRVYFFITFIHSLCFALLPLQIWNLDWNSLINSIRIEQTRKPVLPRQTASLLFKMEVLMGRIISSLVMLCLSV